MYDREFGGVFGGPKEPCRSQETVYAQGFAIYGLSEAQGYGRSQPERPSTVP